jgi:tetratricopeptide (TPR) repeat protein
MTSARELDEVVDMLGRSSKRAALFSFFGLALVLGTLLYSMWQLRKVNSELQAQNAELTQSREALKHYKDYANAELARSRQALSSARAAINAFHSGNLQEALSLYDEALSSDPDNAYLQNLRAYTLFRLGRTDDAIKGQQRSVQVDPSYAWGYFDLARFLCAANPSQMDAAKDAAQKATSLRPDLTSIMRSDGEFQRVCKGQLP